MVMKGRNRNTAWLSITEEEWPEVNKIYEEWLNQALAGNHQSLNKMTAKLAGSKFSLLLNIAKHISIYTTDL
jgi:hypothetical protein